MNTNPLLLSCLDIVSNQFNGGKDTDELRAYVNEILPLDANRYKVTNIQGNEHKFKAEIHPKLANVTDNERFIKDYCDKNNETLRKRSPTVLSPKSIFKSVQYYRCHHKTFHQASMNPSQVLQQKPSKRIKKYGSF